MKNGLSLTFPLEYSGSVYIESSKCVYVVDIQLCADSDGILRLECGNKAV